MCRLLPALVLNLAGIVGSPVRAAPGGELADRLARLDTTVAPANERKALANMLAESVRRRQELNDRSTAAWQALHSRDDWETFLRPKLDALRASIGQFPPPPVALDVRVTGRHAGDGFRVENIILQSRPGLWVTANLYRPASPGPSMPGLLICHAHHTPKEHGELQDMGMTWVRAGCLVLVMDQLGHGERRQHPFADERSYPKPFRASRQDYYFRYDNGIRLHLVGDSLIGWMVWDLMRGVDLLLAQPGADPGRIILLGAVAGGGDPAAVAAALDRRIAAVVPFNFGGPQPETRFPLPDDAERSFDYAGGGSWESTRNLRRSAADGFLPWVIVAGVAPRRLVYAHEFSWDRPHDPVWRRLQTVYGWYGAPDRLAFTHGRGLLQGRPPEASHCTHIGAPHRVLIHDALRRWFGIEVTPEKEYSHRLPADQLRCLTPEVLRDLRPRPLADLLGELAEQRMDQARRGRVGQSPEQQRRLLQAAWARVLGNVESPGHPQARTIGSEVVDGVKVERVLLTAEPGITVPLFLLIPGRSNGSKPPVVVAVAQAGKAGLLRERAADVAGLLAGGAAVCLPDVRGTGESRPGPERGRTSTATALSSSLLMQGETMAGGQLRDLRGVLAWLRTRDDLDAARPALWGDSLTPVNPPQADLAVPRDDDAALPPPAEPLGGLLALFGALYEDGVRAVYARGGLAGFRAVLDGPLVLIPHDAVLPGVLTTGDLTDVAAVLAPRPLCLEGLVDGGNRRLGESAAQAAYRSVADAYRERGAPAALVVRDPGPPLADWLLAHMRGDRGAGRPQPTKTPPRKAGL